MNRNDLKEYFARLKRGQQDAFAGVNRPSGNTRILRESQDLQQSGEHSIEEYVMKDMIGIAFDKGVQVGRMFAKESPQKAAQQANMLGGMLEDEIGAAGLVIPPVKEERIKDLEDIIDDLLNKVLSMGDTRPVDIDHGSFEAQEDYRDSLMNPDYDDDDDDDEMGFSDEYEAATRDGIPSVDIGGTDDDDATLIARLEREYPEYKGLKRIQPPPGISGTDDFIYFEDSKGRVLSLRKG